MIGFVRKVAVDLWRGEAAAWRALGSWVADGAPGWGWLFVAAGAVLMIRSG
jgi:hypothetical protein